jgi:hypothetical protein
MSFGRFLAIGVIFGVATGGWFLLGSTTLVRSDQFSSSLGKDVEALWGGRLVQDAPEFTASPAGPGANGPEPPRKLRPTNNKVEARLSLDYRRKGLIWYSTYVCDFRGSYTVTNREPAAEQVRAHFKFPAPKGTYTDFKCAIDGRPREATVDPAQGITEVLEIAAGQSREFSVAYTTRGLGEWHYRPAAAGGVQNLDVCVETDFPDYDFPEGSLSPTSKDDGPKGATLAWKSGEMLTTQDIAVAMPEKLNPGPLSARITFFAPVCLLFFFLVVGTIGIVRKIAIHPMHYLFVAGGFFAFHLLFAYLVDHLPVHASFAVAAVATVLLVTGYLAGALGGGFPWKLAAAGQFFYLVLFSYSFFLKGMTGLTVTVGAVLTLGVLMWVTAKIDWFAFFGRPKPAAPNGKPLPPMARRIAEDGGIVNAE